MTTKPSLITAQELFLLPADGGRYELREGELRMMSPAGGRHGRIAVRIAQLLANHVDQHQLGVVFAAETGFLISLDPDTVLAPDVAFVSGPRFDQVEDEVHYLPFAPDFAVEVISPSDRFTHVENKAVLWLESGTKLVLLVDPESESVHAYRSRCNVHVFRRDESIDCQDAVPHWTLNVNDIFRKTSYPGKLEN
jgi:Uma2 family endonuclease